jgi:UDP-N-acetylglucosamine 4-epimerase
MMRERVLVTGGAGFIGSALCEALLAAGYGVTCLDNFSTGKRENVESLLDTPSFRLIEGDIRDISACRTALSGVSYVFHEAALGSVPRSIKDPLTTNAVNVDGFLNILQASREAGVRRVIFASSSSVYGNSEQLPKREELIGEPLSPYAVTKYINELYASIFYRTYGLEYIGLRYFNVFGRRQDPFSEYAAVIPLWARRYLAHEPPVINGDGIQSRDFTYIDNVIQANLLCLAELPSSAVNRIYNIACGKRTTLNELSDYLREYLGAYDPRVLSIEPMHGPVRAGDIPHSLASIEKAQALLGYHPRYDVRSGLQESAKWYYENLV